ncbi:endonuclease V [Zavarzinia sp. CC-PAN008]|uniref:endonuclease V n=1 Tax=Zavarzinia sp. CC-PAN008 TaxID=3243332 RepID=UPI003F747576
MDASMILAVDVDYRDGGDAVAAGVLFPDWAADCPVQTIIRRLSGVQPYRPGAFYERELPCIVAVVQACPVPPRIVVIDGHVTLDAAGRPGLGAHLFQALGGRIPVVGVAKSRFRDSPAEAEVLRGRSARPLHVTAIGMDQDEARARIRTMHGANRLPTLLGAVDRACREAA